MWMLSSKTDCWDARNALENSGVAGLSAAAGVDENSGVAGLSAAAVVDERGAVASSTTELPRCEAVESHKLARVPFAPLCRARIDGRSREAPPVRREAPPCRHGGGEEITVITPVVSLDYFSLGLTDNTTGEGNTPTLVLCDSNTTYTPGLMAPRKGPVPHAVRGVFCLFSRVGLHADDPQE